MKRDLDLVRCILVTAESADGAVDESVLLNCCDDIARLAFHVELMDSRGLVVGKVGRDGMRRHVMSVEVSSITWEGYDYLDAIRSPRVWSRAKEAIAETVGDTSLPVVKEACKMIATEMIKTGLGL